MKKWSLGILAVVVIGGLGYGFWSQQAASQARTTTTGHSAIRSTSHLTKKALIVYYSNSGTTATAAKQIQQKTGANMVKLRVSPNYPSDYDQLTVVAKRQIDRNIHPKILNKLNVKKYQTIFLGFPTWYHRPPMFINSFFETYRLKGKTIVPFTTSMSSPMATNRPYLKKMSAHKGLTLQNGFRANDEQSITNYLKQHHLTK
ncbi:flavodoxin [Levilactobacillus acidifarinae]|nr:flavodoxin [Levilactobacillus acidifarinae]